jgi:hypothetical protein
MLKNIKTWKVLAGAIVGIVVSAVIFVPTASASWVGSVLDSVADATIGNLLYGIGALFFMVAGWGVSVAGWLFDTSVQMSVSASTYTSISTIDVAWGLIRNFANIFFLFGLLYIAIATVLNIGNYKRLIAPLIVAALLVNFSLFFTKIVIDVGNVFALYFWQSASQVTINGTSVNSISSVFMQAFNLQTLVSESSLSNLSNTDQAIAYFLGAGAILVVAFVFLAGAVMFVVRTIALIFIMVLSPFAFVAFALPGFQGKASQWWHKLTEYTFFAPAYMFFIYLVAEIARSGQITNALSGAGGSVGSVVNTVGNATTLGSALYGFFGGGTDTTPNLGPIFSYVLILGLMLASLTVASSISKSAGAIGSKWAKKGMGLAYGAGGGWALRNSVGWASRRAASSRGMQAWASKSSIGRGVESMANWGATKSMDFRASAKGFGKAQKGGYNADRDKREKRLVAQAGRINKDIRGETRYETLNENTKYYDEVNGFTEELQLYRGGKVPLTKNVNGKNVVVRDKEGKLKYREFKDTFADTYEKPIINAPILTQIPGVKRFFKDTQGKIGFASSRSAAQKIRKGPSKLEELEKQIADKVKEETGGGKEESAPAGDKH